MFNKSKAQFCQLHKSQVCKGLCVLINCPQSSIYCQQCLEENHLDHLDSCKEFEEMNKDILNSLIKKKNQVDKFKEKYIILNQLSQDQIDSYDMQINDLRKIQRICLNKKCNSLSNIQIQVLKDQFAIDKQLNNENMLHQIEQVIQSLEFIKKDNLKNQKLKFTTQVVKYLNMSGSFCMKVFKFLACVMFVYLFLIGAMLIAILYIESEDNLHFESIRNQTKIEANDLYQMKNYQGAMNLYSKMLYLRKDYDAYFYKGNALSKLQYFEDSIKNYNEALKINSRQDAIQVNKGYALTKLKRFQEAIECFDRAIEINFHNDEAYYLKGRALHELERYFEAVESYNKAININSNNQQYYNSKGLALNHLKEYKEAIKSYDYALLISINQEILGNKATSLLNLEKQYRTQEFYE